MYSVFRNGDENFGGVKVLLVKRSLLTMDKVSALVKGGMYVVSSLAYPASVNGRLHTSLSYASCCEGLTS